ncbi:MAG: hypothetical protein GY760_16990 [Deltaproteobacteria bacterium]|nr:hypothetical protein [Deltaproteobacteria bacterium]
MTTNNLHEDIGSIKEAVNSIKELLSEMKEENRELKERVSILEQFKRKITYIVSIGGAFLILCWELIKEYIINKLITK